MSDDIFIIIAKEIETGNTDTGLWTRAFAECDGDADKTKALYIRLRHADLTAAQSPQTVAPPPIAPIPPDGLGIVRLRLKNKLTETGKQSFYNLLGIPPDVSDAVVTAAIARLNERAATGGALSAEVRYAMDALETPTKRQKYDRELLSTLNPTLARVSARATPMVTASGEGMFDAFWQKGVGRFSKLIIIAIVVLMSLSWISKRIGKRQTQEPTSIVQSKSHAASTPGNESADAISRAGEREATQREAAQEKADKLDAARQQIEIRKSVCKQLIDETRSAVMVRAYTELCAARLAEAEFMGCVDEMRATRSAVMVGSITARCIGDPTAHARVSPDSPVGPSSRPLNCFSYGGGFTTCN